MFIFFFDLDDTLLKTSKLSFLNNIGISYQNLGSTNLTIRNNCINNITSSYSQNIEYDLKLRTLLMKLNYPKYIITNATRIHSVLSLRNLGIIDLFLGGIDANSIPRSHLKPNILPYLEAFKLSNGNSKNICVFFDNLEENHIQPKKLGWITVFIGRELFPSQKPHYIDYSFKNIYDGLSFFIKQNKNNNLS